MSNRKIFKSNYEIEFLWIFRSFPTRLFNFTASSRFLYTKWLDSNLTERSMPQTVLRNRKFPSACDPSFLTHECDRKNYFISTIFPLFFSFNIFSHSIFTVFHNNFHQHLRIELWFISIHIHRTNLNIFSAPQTDNPTTTDANIHFFLTLNYLHSLKWNSVSQSKGNKSNSLRSVRMEKYVRRKSSFRIFRSCSSVLEYVVHEKIDKFSSLQCEMWDRYKIICRDACSPASFHLIVSSSSFSLIRFKSNQNENFSTLSLLCMAKQNSRNGQKQARKCRLSEKIFFCLPNRNFFEWNSIGRSNELEFDVGRWGTNVRGIWIIQEVIWND